MYKKIVVLGFGEETSVFIRHIYKYCNLVAYGIPEIYRNKAKDIIMFCKDNNIKIINGHRDLDSVNPDIVFMCSYAPLIDEKYTDRYIFINIHGALLPEYRGIHGGTWAIINGETYHGYTIHLVDSGIDTGPIYHQGKIKVSLKDDVNSIRRKILIKLKKDIEKIIPKIINGEIVPYKQDESRAKWVCKRRPEDGLINWNDSSKNIFNLIRALTPPYTDGAFTFWHDKKIYIKTSELINTPKYISTVGQVVAKIPKKGVIVKCCDNVLLVKDVIVNEMEINADDLFKKVGTRLGSKREVLAE